MTVKASSMRGMIGMAAVYSLMFVAPAAAVSFGSNDGVGDMSVTGWSDDGFGAAGNMRAYRSGVSVYANGQGVYDGNGNTLCGRFTDNVTSTVNTYRSGSCSLSWPGTIDGAKIRMCTDVFGTDPCGAWSATIRRN